MRADDERFPRPLPRPASKHVPRFIEAEIIALAGRFDLRELAYDRTFAGEIVQHLQDEGINLVQFGQGYVSMSPPAKEIERLVEVGKLHQ